MIDFVKLNGLGNDFVFIDDLDRSLDLTDDQVKWLCDRHFGIGADGVILVRPPKHSGSIAYMHYINSDGSLAQMCGNGVRCFAKYLVDRGLVPDNVESFTVDTLAGPRVITYEVDEQGLLSTATVDMGTPILEPEEIPVDAPFDSVSADGTDYVGNLELESPWGTFRFTCVSMGNPHAVTFLQDTESMDPALFSSTEKSLDTLDIDKVGAFFESHPAFPEKANIEFASVQDDGIHMRVFERGCGETLACGTGACATSVAAALQGLGDRDNRLVLRGGELLISWKSDNHVFMTGKAEESFTGTVDLKRAVDHL